MPAAVGVALGDAAAHYDPSTCRARLRHGVFMLTLNGRVGDLEGVEYAHVDVVRQVGQGAGHAQESHLALALKVQQRPHGTVLLQFRHRRAGVELHEVEVVRVHAA